MSNKRISHYLGTHNVELLHVKGKVVRQRVSEKLFTAEDLPD